MERGEERRRAISYEQASQVFGMQLQLFPELMEEVTILTGGRIGVLHAILHTCSDEISYDPESATTRERIRTMVGAPKDNAQLDDWRYEFWERIKASSTGESLDLLD